MILFRADVLLDGDGTVRRSMGVVVDTTGAIVEVAPHDAIRSGTEARHDVQVLMPGVVNAHTHLIDAEIDEPVPGGDGLTAWVRRLLERRISRPPARQGDVSKEPRSDNGSQQSVAIAAVADALRRMSDAGTVAIGEVSNGAATFEPIAQSGMLTRYIQEMLGFRESVADAVLAKAEAVEGDTPWSDRVRPTLGVHAPYSTSPTLAGLIHSQNTRRGRLTYEHLAEDPAERELYVHGSGPWKDYLREIGAWDPSWRAPGVAPMEVYDRLGLLGPGLAAVHLADASAEEIALVGRRGVRVILSPTSNVHIGDRVPPLDAIVRHGIAFALGTDGRGSNPSVDVFDEARLLIERFEWLDATMLVRALTVNGADILGFGEIGRIAPGYRPGLVAAEITSIEGDARTIARRVIAEPISRRRVG